jgi:hypothetical protein
LARAKLALLLKVNAASAHDFAGEVASCRTQFKWNVTSFSGILLAELTVALAAMEGTSQRGL